MRRTGTSVSNLKAPSEHPGCQRLGIDAHASPLRMPAAAIPPTGLRIRASATHAIMGTCSDPLPSTVGTRGSKAERTALLSAAEVDA